MLLVCMLNATAQHTTYDDNARKYISQYGQLAIAEQKRSGVPASITLAQGIVETEAGTSELMTKACNHFGIKCGKDWNGPYFLHTDDKPNEHFRKYTCCEDSYKDHSDHLKRNARYAPLFTIPVTDYAGWAKGLKKCGYATSPIYAQKLIKTIEDYKLQQYTLLALNDKGLNYITDEPDTIRTASKTSAENSTPAANTADIVDRDTVVDLLANEPGSPKNNIIVQKPGAPVVATEKPNTTYDTTQRKYQDPVNVTVAVSDKKYDNIYVTTVNGLKAIYVNKDESLLPYATKLNIRYAHLLEWNDLPDAPLPCQMPVYLEKKLQEGTHPKHPVKENENLLLISQTEGIQLRKLMALNMLEPGEEPAVGVQLELQVAADRKPELRNINPDQVQNMSLSGLTASNATNNSNDYLPVDKPKQKDTALAKDHVIAKKDSAVAPVHTITNKPSNTYHEQTTDTAVTHEDLSALKADLDKMVYARDNPSLSKKQVSPKPEKNKPEPLAKKTTAKKAKIYKVKKGDTLYDIARKNNTTVKQLEQWNALKRDNLKLGQTLKILD